MRQLSRKLQHILDFLRSYVDDKGYPPSIREIQKACQISSTSVVDYNLDILEREGYIRRDAEISRGIEVLDRLRHQPRILRIPVVGSIAAGEPIPVPETDSFLTTEMADSIALTEDMLKDNNGVYALRVRGTSMIDALINDGDIVLMKHVDTADNGEMVAVWLRNEKEVTLKRFYREPNRVRLQPANSQMVPIYAEPGNVQIQGKVIGVIRQVS